jgi:predicted lipoprotein
MNKLRSITACSLLLLCSACVERQNDPLLINSNNLNLALQNTVDNTVLRSVSDFSAASTDLYNQSIAFCAATGSATETDINNLQQSWRDVNNRWYALAPFHFGPIEGDLLNATYSFIDSLRVNGSNYLATVRSENAKNIDASSTLNRAFFSAKSFQYVGLLSLESLLFETADNSHSQIDADILAEYQAKPRKCAVLNGISEQLMLQAEAINTDWNIQYLNSGKSYRSLFINNELSSGTNITTLISAVQQHLDYLRARNVATTAGSLAGSSYAAIGSALQNIEYLLEGETTTTVSFLQFIEVAGNANYVASIRSNLNRAKQAAADEDASALNAAIALLDGNFKREVPNGLNVELGLNFTDGD